MLTQLEGQENNSGSPFNRGVQHEAKRNAILSRAAKLFNTKGARATTLSDVANKLGLTKTSLYYYVRTKEDLIFQCYEATLEHAHKTLDDIELSTSAPLERVLLFMERHCDTILKALAGKGDYYAAPLEIASLKPDHRTHIEGVYLSMFMRVRGYLRAGIADGTIQCSHATTTTRALIGALDWSFYWLYEMPEDEAMRAVAATRDIVCHGLFESNYDYQPKAHPLTPEAAAAARGFDREAQNRLKQEAFFKAGTRLFNIKGFNGTSLDQIAEHLQVSKGAFYYHFANKESLLTQCYEYSMDQLGAIYTEMMPHSGLGPAKLDAVCRRIFNLQNSELGPMIRYNTITALPPPIRRKVLTRTESLNNNLGELIKSGIESATIRPVNVRVAQNLLMGSINASMDIGTWRRVDDVDAAAIDYFEVFYFGLQKR